MPDLSNGKPHEYEGDSRINHLRHIHISVTGKTDSPEMARIKQILARRDDDE